MTPETKALIEQEAKEYGGAIVIGDFIHNVQVANRGIGYIAGATPYAEKWEASEQENKRLRDAIEQARNKCYSLVLSYNDYKDNQAACTMAGTINDIGSICTEALKQKQ